jgi:hypothetical protein
MIGSVFKGIFWLQNGQLGSLETYIIQMRADEYLNKREEELKYIYWALSR